MRWTKQVNSVFGHPLGIRYEECGDVRFFATTKVSGKTYEYVLLYAEDLGDGRYSIGSTWSGFFDSGQREIPLFQGFLDRVPSPGEYVDDWITDFTKEEDEQAMATSYRFLRDNGLDGDALGIAYPDWLPNGL